MGFGVPVGPWLRGPLRSLLEDALLASDAHIRPLVQPAAIRQLVREHVTGGADHTPFLWCLLMLELWFRECVAARSSVVATVPAQKAN
jgi:asparagine synthase (glutamine-hydrolysing)